MLMEYALEFADTEFSGFIFNSPFLDWGQLSGQLVEYVKDKEHAEAQGQPNSSPAPCSNHYIKLHII